nr:MAG TPA: hypothetical protein [Caudoviricetes sp.]
MDQAEPRTVCSWRCGVLSTLWRAVSLIGVSFEPTAWQQGLVYPAGDGNPAQHQDTEDPQHA